MTFDGLDFTEVASVTRIRGGIARNVVPDEAVATVNSRYAPGRDAADAEALAARLCARPRRAAHRLQRAVGAGGDGQPARAARCIAAGDLPVEPKQAWTPGRRVRRAPASTPSTSAPATRPSPTRATSRSTVAALVARLRDAREVRVRLNPVLDGLATYPFVRLDRGQGRPRVARGVDVIDFGVGEPREETPAFIRRALAEARRGRARVGLPAGRGPAGAARGDRGLGRAALRRARSTRPRRSSRRSAPRRRSSTWRRSWRRAATASR